MERDCIYKFLTEFKALAKIHGVYFIDREKNDKALFELDISRWRRNEELLSLTVDDYVSGPSRNQILGMNGDVWVFGRFVCGKECYIKICINTIVSRNGYKRNCICISFHVAEYPLKYYFKTKRL